MLDAKDACSPANSGSPKAGAGLGWNGKRSTAGKLCGWETLPPGNREAEADRADGIHSVTVHNAIADTRLRLNRFHGVAAAEEPRHKADQLLACQPVPAHGGGPGRADGGAPVPACSPHR